MSLQKKQKLETSETEIEKANSELESMVLETRKVKALEKIANSLDALTVWFEEINKKEWGERIAYYLYEFYNMAKDASIETEQSNNRVNKKLLIPDTDDEKAGEVPPPRKIRPKKDIEKV